MAKAIGILALLAWLAAAGISYISFGWDFSHTIANVVSPMWGLGCAADANQGACVNWGNAFDEGRWRAFVILSISYGWAVALACLIWRKWTTIDAKERRPKPAASRAIQAERRRVKRE